MKQPQAIEAIILKSIAHQEKSYIVTLFSKELGKICVASRLSKKTAALSPLSLIEAVVTPSDKQIVKCRSLEVRNVFFHLRQNLNVLRLCLQMCRYLEYTLPLCAPVSALYEEFMLFVQHIAHYKTPHVAAVKFLAKLCLLDGILGVCPPLSQEEVALCLSFANQPYEALQDAFCEKALLEKLFVVAGR